MDWAVILAGGNGTRLQSFTRQLAGDDRPKQFCALFGGQTLFASTRARIERNVVPSRILSVVTQDHQPYYASELATTHPLMIVEQPRARGTGAAIAYSLARLSWFDTDPIVGFFPADHHYEYPEAVRRTLEATYRLAEQHPHVVFLIGAEADHPETEYGWIEPGAVVPTKTGVSVWSVNRFWEKPPMSTAELLFERRCLWNTFVLVGKASAFQELLRLTVPPFADRFQALAQRRGAKAEAAVSHIVYDNIPAFDFSHHVLASRPDRLGVVRLSRAGWTDLGRPARVEAIRERVTALARPQMLPAAS